VNAFNLMAILGGFRQSDSGILLFMSYQALGHDVVCCSSPTSPYLIYRRRDAEMYMYLMFLLPLGSSCSRRACTNAICSRACSFSRRCCRGGTSLGFYAVLTVTYYLNLWYICGRSTRSTSSPLRSRWGSPSRSSTAAVRGGDGGRVPG